jgi:hypothetical protein
MSDETMYDIVLYSVLTVREIVEGWHKDQKNVMMAIYQGRLAARQVENGKTWLISRASVVKLWGEEKSVQNV